MNKTNIKELYIILLINTFVFFFFNYVHPVTPQLLDVHNISAKYNGIFYGMMNLGMVISSPLFGKNLKIITIKKIMIISVLGYSISQELFAFGGNAPLMALSRIISGGFASGWVVASYQYVNQRTDDSNKTKFFGYIMVSNALAGILGQLSSGMLAKDTTIYTPFIIQLIGLFIVGLVIYLFVEQDSKINKEDLKKIKQHKKHINIKIIFQDKSIYTLLTIMLMSIVLSAYTSQIGYYAFNKLKFTSFGIAEVNAYTSLIHFIMNIYFVHKLDSILGTEKTYKLQIIIALFGAIMMILFFNQAIFISAGLLLIGISIYMPLSQKLTLKVTNVESGLMMGYINSFKSIGMVSGSILAGFLYEIKIVYVIYMIIIALILSLLLQIISSRTNKE